MAADPRPVDELRAALELAQEEELQALTELLYRPQFNPLDYLQAQPWQGFYALPRQEWLDRLEERLRYLAADGWTVLRGRSDRLAYRDILERISHHLGLGVSPAWEVTEVEAEIFLHLLERTWQRLPAAEQVNLRRQMRETLAQQPLYQQLPQRLQDNPLGLLAKGGSALALQGVVRPWLLQQIAHQFALHLARQQLARQALRRGGLGLVGQVHQRAALHLAGRGMALNAARYGAVQGVFSVLGPALWLWFFADLGWRTVATNPGRVIPAVFLLAQVRLLRGQSAAATMAVPAEPRG